MTLKLNKLAALVGVALGVMAAPPTFAANEGMAQAVRQISDFALYKGGDATTLGPLLTASDFTTFFITDNASLSATLNGVNSSVSNPAAPPSPPQNLLQRCVGAGGVGTGDCAPYLADDTDYTNHTNAAVKTFARSDMMLQGVLVGGVPLNGTGPGSESTPASSKLVAEVQIQGGGTGSSTTRSGTGGSVQFSLANNGVQILIDFKALNYLYAYVNPGVAAQASSSLSFSLLDSASNEVFSWAPRGDVGGITGGTEFFDECNLNNTINANSVSNGPTVRSCAATSRFRALTDPLSSSELYTLTFIESTFADVTVTRAVPEPGSLAIVGAALVGLGLTRRRRTLKVA